MKPEPTSRTPASRSYEPALDGLRAFAVGLLVWFHARPAQVPGGFFGVTVFFTLSGFLICRLVLDEVDRSGTLSLVNFWVRRFRRLIPAAMLTLLGVAAVTSLSPMIWGRAPSTVGADLLGAYGQVANWWFYYSGQSYSARFSPSSPVAHFWSLSVEEQFYLFFPALVLLSHRLKEGRAWFGRGLVCAALGSWLLMWLLPVGDHAYYGTDTRIGEIAVGCWLALVLRNETWEASRRDVQKVLAPLGWLCPLFIVGICLLCPEHERTPWIYPWGFVAVSFLTAATIVGVSCEGASRRLLSLAPLPSLGRISYGVYLVHWPVLLLCTPDRLGLSASITLCVQLFAILVLATLSYHLVEQPLRRGQVLRRTPVAVALWLLIGIGLFAWMQQAVLRSGAPAVWTTQTQEELAARFAQASSEEFGEGREVRELPVSLTQDLENDAEAAGESVLLLRGDSVPDYLASAAAAWGRSKGLKVRNGAKFSCSLVTRATVSGEPCPSLEEDLAIAADQRVDGVLWFPGVNDVFFDVDGLAGTSEAGRRALLVKLGQRLRAYTDAGIPVVVNEVARPAPLQPTSEYNDAASIAAFNAAIRELQSSDGVVVSGAFAAFMARRPKDRLLRPDGIHTPDPKVGLAVFEAGLGDTLLAALERATRELER